MCDECPELDDETMEIAVAPLHWTDPLVIAAEATGILLRAVGDAFTVVGATLRGHEMWARGRREEKRTRREMSRDLARIVNGEA